MGFNAPQQAILLGILNESLEACAACPRGDQEAAYNRAILQWSLNLDAHENKLDGHVQRVAEMSVHIGRHLELNSRTLAWLYRGALLHDIGKMAIPDVVLSKPGALSNDEQEVIKQHPRIGFEMLREIMFLEPCLDILLYHHERWDGSGYPYGLSGPQIPYLARVFMVADVWDALRSKRVYRESWSEEQTRHFIRNQAQSWFDPDILQAFLETEPLPHPADAVRKAA